MAQRLRERFGQENVRVVSLSRKARSAMMLAGPKADVVVWHSGGGNWATSVMYDTPDFLVDFLRANPVEKDFRAVWNRTLPGSRYLYQDRARGERPSAQHWSDRFPHRLRENSGQPDAAYFSAWSVSPFVDDYLGQMAVAVTDHMRLGRQPGTDVLAIGFSSLDSVGHAFGPRSHEVQDTLVRLDVTIGRLLDHLDRSVGRANYVVALSADHGVATIPEQLLVEGEDAGRVASTRVFQAAQQAAEKHLGPGRHVQAAMYTDLYFTAGTYPKLRDRPEALAEVMEAIARVPGVARVFRGDDLPLRRNSGHPLERAAALSYFPGRSGDLIVVPRENWFFVTASNGRTPATHGTAHWYDARVPVIFWGHGIRPGKYSVAASPADIAPTLAALCGVDLIEADGRVLGEALAPVEKIRVSRPSSLIH
jgi:predicted AlkP superfamily pyrophosphatase or phosphodiesterase